MVAQVFGQNSSPTVITTRPITSFTRVGTARRMHWLEGEGHFNVSSRNSWLRWLVVERNDADASLEYTVVVSTPAQPAMAYGDNGGVVGYSMPGQPNRGLEYMFIMMNEARLGVVCGPDTRLVSRLTTAGFGILP